MDYERDEYDSYRIEYSFDIVHHSLSLISSGARFKFGLFCPLWPGTGGEACCQCSLLAQRRRIRGRGLDDVGVRAYPLERASFCVVTMESEMILSLALREFSIHLQMGVMVCYKVSGSCM